MKLRRLSKFFVLLLLFLTSFHSLIRADAAYNKLIASTEDGKLKTDGEDEKHTFAVLACITWWSHDAVGYHPSMSLFLENITDGPITGADSASTSRNSLNARLGGEIPFQGRFTELRSGDVTVAREYRRAPIRDHERFAVFLRGPRSYELPIDSSLWPSIECKAMCRLNDNGAEVLYIGHLTQVTLTDEDAQAQLVALAGRSPLLSKNRRGGKNGSLNAAQQEGSDSASESDLGQPQLRGMSNIDSVGTKHPSKSMAMTKNIPAKNSIPKYLPAVGDDFYAFDKLYGGATQFQAASGREDLTWTHYKANGLISDIYAGSRNANKADVVILSLKSAGSIKDKDLMTLGKMLAHCGKNDSIAPFSHSVRYLPSGRSEYMITAIRDFRILSFKAQEPKGNSPVLVVSRLPGDLEASLSTYSKSVSFLKFLDMQSNSSH